MNTKTTILTAAAIALILGAGIWIYLQNPQEPALPNITERVFEEETDEYLIHIAYPHIQNLSNPDVQTALNETFAPDADDIRNVLIEGQQEAREWALGDPDFVHQSYRRETFETQFVSQTLLSITFERIQYFGTEAHEMITAHVANYNLATGKEILLQDIFTKDSNYVQVLSDISIADLRNRLEFDIGITSGAGPEEENFNKFAITERALVILFDPYQVASFSEGFQEVRIPYSQIENIIDTTGPLNFYFKLDTNAYTPG